jgi:hypothetical protein
MKKNYSNFKIIKADITANFTKVPNVLIIELMQYLTPNELKLILYILQKDSTFQFNRHKIAEKFDTDKNNIDKVFSSLEKKKILFISKDEYHINLYVDMSDFKFRKLDTRTKRKISHIKNHPETSTSSNTLSEVKDTSHEVKVTSPNLDSEVKDTSPTEVKHTSPTNSTKPSIHGTFSEKKSSNNTNNNNTIGDITNRDYYLNKDIIEVNSNSIIDETENEMISPKLDLKNDSSISEELIIKEEKYISNSIPFIIEHDPRLVDDFKSFTSDPNEFSNYSDGYIAIIVLSYLLKDRPQWKEIKNDLNFNWKYLGGLLYTCKSALALQFYQDIPNNLAEEIIKQSKLSQEELESKFFNI